MKKNRTWEEARSDCSCCIWSFKLLSSAGAAAAVDGDAAAAVDGDAIFKGSGEEALPIESGLLAAAGCSAWCDGEASRC